MPNFAQITLIGHVGRPDELKYIPNGTAVLRFSLAVNTGYGEKKTVSWYSCQLWGKQAETLTQYIVKGKPLQVVGEPQIRLYTGRDGTQKTSVEVRVFSVTLLGSGQSHDQPETASDEAPPVDDDGSVPF